MQLFEKWRRIVVFLIKLQWVGGQESVGTAGDLSEREKKEGKRMA